MQIGDTIIQRKVPCVMRDGVTLYSDIYLPIGSEHEEFPVLLMRQPYGRALASTVSYAHPIWYASRGYIVVIQDVRGRGDSEGDFDPFIHEAEDGYETVEWAAALPNSNGKVGMYGFSYQGITQWAAASLKPPSLRAIAPCMCPADLYEGMFYPHGRFAIGDQLPWAFQLARDAAIRAGDNDAAAVCSSMMRNREAGAWQMPLERKHPVLETYFPAYYDWLAHEEYDSYWDERNFLKNAVDHRIPSLHIAGWYDTFLMGSLKTYIQLQDQPETDTCFHRMIIGPWTHIPWGRYAGGVDHGYEAGGQIHEEHIRWFDYWLKGTHDNGLADEQTVRYYEQGSCEWKTAERLPGDLSHYTDPEALQERLADRWYLSGTSNPANGILGGGKLLHSPQEIQSAAPDVFVYDARLPMRLEGYSPVNRQMQQERYEILVYSSDTLQEDLSLFGSPQLSVQVQTIGGPTDLIAILTVVEQDGTARFLSVGRTEISSEHGTGLNQWTEARITMRPLAVKLRIGTTIRLELTGSAFPLFTRHPNGIAGSNHKVDETELRMATIAVMSSTKQESYIELPIVQRGDSVV